MPMSCFSSPRHASIDRRTKACRATDRSRSPVTAKLASRAAASDSASALETYLSTDLSPQSSSSVATVSCDTGGGALTLLVARLSSAHALARAASLCPRTVISCLRTDAARRRSTSSTMLAAPRSTSIASLLFAPGTGFSNCGTSTTGSSLSSPQAFSESDCFAVHRMGFSSGGESSTQEGISSAGEAAEVGQSSAAIPSVYVCAHYFNFLHNPDTSSLVRRDVTSMAAEADLWFAANEPAYF